MMLEIITPVVKHPREWGGVDYGSEQIVLARAGTRELQFRPGCRFWSGLGMPQAYAPATLVLAVVEGFSERSKVLAEGRLSFKLLREHATEIDAWLGCDEGVSAVGRVDPKKRWTVEVKS